MGWRTILAPAIVCATLLFARRSSAQDEPTPPDSGQEDDEDETDEKEEKKEEPLPPPKFLTPCQLRCLVAAKNPQEVKECLPQNGDKLVVRAGLELGAYTDSLAVDVWTPSLTAGIASPTAGWNVNGHYTLDVVSAASPDIVSMASRKSRGEKRHEVGVSGTYKPNDVGVQAGTLVSSEPDELSMGFQVAAMVDLDEKLVTPRLGYEFRHDTIGKGGTSFDVFHHDVASHTIDASVTFVMTARTLLLLGMTGTMEHGDSSKPYRYIPMFAPSDAPKVSEGLSPNDVNKMRLPVRPLEQLPLSRYRWALGGRLAQRIGAASTLRLEERLYVDSWGIDATSTDMKYLVDVGDHFRLWPHVRVHAQTGASFQHLAYTADVDSRGNVSLPALRTGDRELGKLVGLTLGAGVRWAISAPADKTQFGVSLQGETMFTRYYDDLYTTSRTALYGALGFDAEVR